MVRNYKKKRRLIWNDSELKLAFERIKNGQSIKSVAVELGIPRTTLQRKFQLMDSQHLKAGKIYEE